MSLSIDLFCSEGSPMGLTPPDIHGRGVGGAELAMMTWAQTMASRGHRVRIYNNSHGEFDGVEYLSCNQFEVNYPRDVYIVFRSPSRYTRIARAAVKLFWSCDQYTSGNFATDIFPFVDRTICISPYHVQYHLEHYNPINPHTIGYFDLGVRIEEYKQDIEKIPGRCIFCSVPERGLEILRLMWPKIRERIPEASLVITSDYTLWGAPQPLNHEHRLRWLGMEGISFLGKIPREQLVQEQLRAECMPYPCTYNELFCISAAECQISGAIPVTSDLGALSSTAELGYVHPGNILDKDWQASFVETVTCILDGTLEVMSLSQTVDTMVRQAKRRFDWQTICSYWEHLIEHGDFVTVERELA